ncbi:hypothetical protein V2J09_014771 [Rumex salicifolius]
MGSSETDKSSKDPKTPTRPPSTTQEQSSATSTGAVNPEWSGFQAYSPMPHGYLASSPQAHPYMWSVQPMMPPYGTPSHPYMAMYPHGVYAHPSIPPGSYPYSPFAVPPANAMPEASGNMPVVMDVDAKLPVGKEKLPIKRSKGSLGSLNMITGKKKEQVKSKGPLANGTYSKSGESSSDGSTEGSDANSQNDSQIKCSDRQESLEADASQNGSSMHGPQNGLPNPSHAIVNSSLSIVPMPAAPVGAVAGPTTNLNIGMDYWGSAATPSAIPAMHGNVSSTPIPTGIVTAGSRENLQSQVWVQDERELKRQRRKQSNRESARRSRLRKQAECDELGQRADVLKEENASLKSKLNRIRMDYEQLLAENKMLKEKLGKVSDGRQREQGESGH